MTIGCVIVSRNDNYGYFLRERAIYCINSMLLSMDEIVYVDWNTPLNKPTLLDDIEEGILDKSGRILSIRVTPEEANEFVHGDKEAQNCVEVMARNIGLRRLNTDYMVSTNIDIICPQKKHLSKFDSKDTFYTTGLRGISLFDLWPQGRPTEPNRFIPFVESVEPMYPQRPPIQVCEGDTSSLVSSCGDFQVAHKDIWYAIKGFEERLYKRAYADSNVQRKAQIFGFNTKVEWSVPVWHIGHDGGMGGVGGMNNMNLAIFMNETTNPDTWGFSNVDFEAKRI